MTEQRQLNKKTKCAEFQRLLADYGHFVRLSIQINCD